MSLREKRDRAFVSERFVGITLMLQDIALLFIKGQIVRVCISTLLQLRIIDSTTTFPLRDKTIAKIYYRVMIIGNRNHKGWTETIDGLRLDSSRDNHDYSDGQRTPGMTS